jgi:hypothetical protein
MANRIESRIEQLERKLCGGRHNAGGHVQLASLSWPPDGPRPPRPEQPAEATAGQWSIYDQLAAMDDSVPDVDPGSC